MNHVIFYISIFYSIFFEESKICMDAICNPTHPTFSHLEHNTEKYFFSAYAYSPKHVTVMRKA